MRISHIAVILVLFCVGLIHLITLDQVFLLKAFFAKEVHNKNGFSVLEHTDLIKELPGQTQGVEFKQYGGYINVDSSSGRSLFYYFVEAVSEPTSKPLVLWLNGGPGCSSLGNGAFVENGPFGVQKDGMTLYLRKYSWNRVANLLYLESPAGVGFSYSNTTSDYNSTGDTRTAQDSYAFLKKWFARFPQYKKNDFHIAGESYAGHYIPELAALIIQNNIPGSSRIQLKGVMVGNGLMNYQTDKRGIYDFSLSHGLISNQTYQGLLKFCFSSKVLECSEFQKKADLERGTINVYNLYSQDCSLDSSGKSSKDGIDACEKQYVSIYMNLPYVQKALHANITKLPYSWGMCSSVLSAWKDNPSTMLPIYRRLMDAGIRILLYSGDVDAVIPMTSTLYSINALNLTIRSNWKPWFDATQQVAGYRIDYEGMTFMTVLGAGHEVPRYQPSKAFTLVRLYLEGM